MSLSVPRSPPFLLRFLSKMKYLHGVEELRFLHKKPQKLGSPSRRRCLAKGGRRRLVFCKLLRLRSQFAPWDESWNAFSVAEDNALPPSILQELSV